MGGDIQSTKRAIALHFTFKNEGVRASMIRWLPYVDCKPVEEKSAVGSLPLEETLGNGGQNGMALYSHGEGAGGSRHSPQVRSLHLMDARGGRE